MFRFSRFEAGGGGKTGFSVAWAVAWRSKKPEFNLIIENFLWNLRNKKLTILRKKKNPNYC